MNAQPPILSCMFAPIRRLLEEGNLAKVLLLALLFTDVVFLTGHIGLDLIGADGYFDPAIEQASGEGYQYVKWIWCTLMCWSLGAFLPLHRGWTASFTYLFLDDSLGLHERAGIYLSHWLHLQRFEAYYRPIEIGEAIYLCGLGVLYAGLFLVATRTCTAEQRATFYPFAFLLCAVLLFGGVGDILHAAFWDARAERLFELVEETGEMLVMSVMTAYLFSLWCTTGAWPGSRRISP